MVLSVPMCRQLAPVPRQHTDAISEAVTQCAHLIDADLPWCHTPQVQRRWTLHPHTSNRLS